MITTETNAPEVITNLNSLISRVKKANERRYFSKIYPFAFMWWYFTPLLMMRDKSGPCPSKIFHWDIFKALTEFTRSLILAFRWSGKSFISDLIIPMWLMNVDPYDSHGMDLYLMTNDEMVAKVIDWIVEQFITNKTLQYDYGKIFDLATCTHSRTNKPEVSTKNKFHYYVRTYQTLGPGPHPDRFTIDDIIDQEAIDSDRKMGAIVNVINNKVKPMMGEYESLHWLGTVLSDGDPIVNEYNSGEWQIKLKIPGKKYVNGKWQGMWPEWRSLNELDNLEKAMNSQQPGSFDCQIMLETIASQDAIFPPEIIRVWNKRPPWRDMSICTGIDLNAGKEAIKTKNSETAIVSMGRLRKSHDWGNQGEIFELLTNHGRYSPDQRINITVDHLIKFNFRNKLVIEDKVAARDFAAGIKRELINRGIDAKPMIRFVEPVDDKRTRAERVEPYFADGMVWLDPNGEFRKQLKNFTGRDGRLCDIVDAGVYSILKLMKLKGFEDRVERKENRRTQEVQFINHGDEDRGAHLDRHFARRGRVRERIIL